MENPDAYRAGKDLVEFEWRQNHRNYYSSFSLKFYQENDMPLLTGWFPSQSGGDEIRESQTDAFSNPIPWQLTWVQWFELQNVLAESDLPAHRKPSSDSYDEVDSEIRIVWRTDDGDEAQTLSGSQAEALEALVLGIAEEAYHHLKIPSGLYGSGMFGMPSSGIPRKSSRMKAGIFRITSGNWPSKVTCRTALSLISQNRLRLLKSPWKILLHPIGMKSAPTSECFRRISLLLLISMTGQV